MNPDLVGVLVFRDLLLSIFIKSKVLCPQRNVSDRILLIIFMRGQVIAFFLTPVPCGTPARIVKFKVQLLEGLAVFIFCLQGLCSFKKTIVN